MITKRDNCRLCGSQAVDLIFKMPASPPVDNFRKLEEKDLLLPWFPMDLYMCKSCHHAQLLDVVSPDILFGNYIYTSSSSPDLDQHFTAYASHVERKLHLKSSQKILDVGSNDGLLLSKFQQLGFQVLGVEPAQSVASIAIENGIPTEIGFLRADFASFVGKKHGKMDLITANNVFSHADDLREFACSVHDLLADDGTFIFEVSYLKDLVDHFVIDYIYHEHLCHHSIVPLKKFLESCGFKLIDVERIQTKGGSIRCYAAKASNSRSPSSVIEEMIQQERAQGLYDRATYKRLEQKVQTIRKELLELIQKETSQGHKVASYGASATSTVLNALLGISEWISFIIDDNPLRQNRFSAGYLVPILSSEALKTYKPKYVIISAWRFAENIMKKNAAYKQAGGKFLIPFPHLRVE